MGQRLLVTWSLLSLVFTLALPLTASAQVVVVNPPGPGRVVVRAPRHGRTVVVNPPGPGRVVVHDPPGVRRDRVVINPPGPGRVVIRRGRR